MSTRIDESIAIATSVGTGSEAAFGPWNPGVESEIPDAIRHLSTFLRPENVFTSIPAARELCDFTGLDLPDVVAFRPGRLALHELLIRVTADLSVPDGVRIEDLGINFRRITRALLASAVAPRMDSLAAMYDSVRREVSALIARELAALYEAPMTAASAKRSQRAGAFAFLARRRPPEPRTDAGVNRELRIAAELEASAYRALARVLSAVLVRHGRLWGSREMIAALATDIACNAHAGDE